MYPKLHSHISNIVENQSASSTYAILKAIGDLFLDSLRLSGYGTVHTNLLHQELNGCSIAEEVLFESIALNDKGDTILRSFRTLKHIEDIITDVVENDKGTIKFDSFNKKDSFILYHSTGFLNHLFDVLDTWIFHFWYDLKSYVARYYHGIPPFSYRNKMYLSLELDHVYKHVSPLMCFRRKTNRKHFFMNLMSIPYSTSEKTRLLMVEPWLSEATPLGSVSPEQGTWELYKVVPVKNS